MAQWINATNFRVTIEGCDEDTSFVSVSEVTTNIEAIEYKHGMDKTVRRAPGRVSFGNVTLKRSYQGLDELHQWKTSIENGIDDRRTVSVEYLKDDHTVVRRYELYGCFPVMWKLPAMDSNPAAVNSGVAGLGTEYMALEEIEMTVEKVLQLA
jgi:phage tail-like protein